MKFNKSKYGWLWHSLYLILVAIFSIYGIVAVFFHQLDFRKWTLIHKGFAAILVIVLVLPIVSAIIETLVTQEKKNP